MHLSSLRHTLDRVSTSKSPDERDLVSVSEESSSSSSGSEDLSMGEWRSETTGQTFNGSSASSTETTNTSEEDSELDIPPENAEDTEKAPIRKSSRKHNEEFHKLFSNIPKDERLVRFFTCALVSDILVQGRLFVTSKRVAFHSNIFGWVTQRLIRLSDIEEFEPKFTAGIFPNAIAIKQHDGTRITFASFVNRDDTLALLQKLLRSVSDLPTSVVPTSSEIDQMSIDDSPGGGRSRISSMSHSAGHQVQNASGDEEAPQTHSPTKLPSVEEKEKILVTETIESPLPRVANLLFGKDTEFYRHFLVDIEGNRDLDNVPGFKDKKRYYEYTKPLSGPVGPKETKCKCTETIESWDFNNGASILQATETPDVPSGNAFTTMTRIALAWGPDNQTELRLSTWIAWSGKSWLKGPIEKGAIDGQTSFAQSLVKELHAKLVSGTTISKPVTEPHAKRPRKKRHQKSVSTLNVPLIIAAAGAMVVLLLVFVYFGFLRHAGNTQTSSQERQDGLSLIEQELQLWEWIDDRSSFDAVKHRTMSDREMEEAIRITEERLHRLKEALVIPEERDM